MAVAEFLVNDDGVLETRRLHAKPSTTPRRLRRSFAVVPRAGVDLRLYDTVRGRLHHRGLVLPSRCAGRGEQDDEGDSTWTLPEWVLNELADDSSLDNGARR